MEDKVLNAERRGRSKQRTKRKKETYARYGWMRDISPVTRRIAVAKTKDANSATIDSKIESYCSSGF